MKSFLLLSFLILSLFGASAQNIIYVDSAASGLNNGSSWSDAHTDLQDALEAAQPGEQIWVAKGTYKPSKDENDNITTGGSRRFTMRPGVKIYGGFKGTEATLKQRDWRHHKSILSGKDSIYDYSLVVVRATNLDSTAAIDGFFITGGYNDQGYSLADGGGAILVQYGSPTLSNLVLYGCYSHRGGGLGLRNSSSLIANVIITENETYKYDWTSGRGGGIYMQYSSPTLINCIIENNAGANEGTAMLTGYSAPLIINTVISNNYTTNGVLRSAVANSTTSNPIFVNSIIEGGVYCFTPNGSNAVFRNSVIENSGGSSNWNTSLGVNGGGNLDIALAYTDSANGNYRLMDCSPAFDVGVNSFLPTDIFDMDYDGDTTEPFPIDMDGRPRISNGTVDIGAYEGYYGFDTLATPLCMGRSLKIQDSLITTAGMYTFKIARSGMCDSIIYYDVRKILDMTIAHDSASNTYYVSDSNAVYQWYDCTHNYILPADTNQSFTPWIASSYQVIVTKDGCTDTSDCFVVNKVGMDQIHHTDLSVSVYPNPSSGVYTVVLPEASTKVEAIVKDLNGKSVLREKITATNSTIDLSQNSSGVYILQLNISGQMTYHKLIRE